MVRDVAFDGTDVVSHAHACAVLPFTLSPVLSANAEFACCYNLFIPGGEDGSQDGGSGDSQSGDSSDSDSGSNSGDDSGAEDAEDADQELQDENER